MPAALFWVSAGCVFPHFPLHVNGPPPPSFLVPLAPPRPFTPGLLGVTLLNDTPHGRILLRMLCRGGRGLLRGLPLSHPCMLIVAGVDDNPCLMVFLDGRVHLDRHSLLCGSLPDGSRQNLPCGSLLDGSHPSRLCWGILLDDCCLRVSILLFVFLIVAAVDLFLGNLLLYLLLDDTLILLKLFPNESLC